MPSDKINLGSTDRSLPIALLRARETTRQPDQKDGRISLISITKEGRALIAEHAAESQKIFGEIKDQFGSENLDTLLNLLDELRQIKV